VAIQDAIASHLWDAYSYFFLDRQGQRLKTVNSLSGGKTSSYMAVHYPADYNLFALIRTDDKSCMFPDAKIRQIVSDKIGAEFIGTLEQDEIIYTMLDLEQYIGKDIVWLSPSTFEGVIKKHSTDTKTYLPNVMQRFCTVDMKITPIKNWLYENTELPVVMRMGFRANETSRAIRMTSRQREDGIEWDKFIVGNRGTRNKWGELPYRVVEFPLISDGIYKHQIENYWSDKSVRFAYMNNCVGCFHRNEMLLKLMSSKEPSKFDWFVNQENSGAQFKKETSYAKIKSHKLQIDLFDNDFDECDSGYCGL
jgi:hypothetical protein